MKEEASTHNPITVPGQSQVALGTTHISRLTDDQLIKEFLSGSYCLHGVSWLSRGASAGSLLQIDLTLLCVSGCRVVEV